MLKQKKKDDFPSLWGNCRMMTSLEEQSSDVMMAWGSSLTDPQPLINGHFERWSELMYSWTT
jgi:hypothetical protein